MRSINFGNQFDFGAIESTVLMSKDRADTHFDFCRRRQDILKAVFLLYT